MLLFGKGNMWERKDWDLFDEGIGINVAAEVCQLVGTFSLGKISENVINVKWDYIGMAVYQSLETNVVLN